MAKLVIKLKLLGNEEGDKTQKNLHICKICNKVFSSGRAYGGHKRIHSMKSKEKKPLEEINIQFCDARPRYTKCNFCPKTFRAQKSFEEHMKTHGLRACNVDNVQPALARNDSKSSSTLQSNALEAEADDRVISATGENQIFSGLPKDLPLRWGKTGRRGRNAAKADLICVPSSIDMYQGADDLMVLSPGKIQAGNLPLKKRKVDSLPPQEMDLQCIKTEVDYDQGREKIPVHVDNSGETSTEKKKASRAFVCHVCGKPFGSYHALGGHNAHHKKKANGDFVEGSTSRLWRHRCPHCHKSYMKSQALQAHRRYCEQAITPLTDQVVALEEATIVVPKRAPFDLNELPPPETEDEMGGEEMQG